MRKEFAEQGMVTRGEEAGQGAGRDTRGAARRRRDGASRPPTAEHAPARDDRLGQYRERERRDGADNGPRIDEPRRGRHAQRRTGRHGGGDRQPGEYGGQREPRAG